MSDYAPNSTILVQTGPEYTTVGAAIKMPAYNEAD